VLIAYEDQRFWEHKGVDPKAVVRASYDFVKSGQIVSGASTLTMQVAKLMDPSLKRRNPIVKIKQMLSSAEVGASLEQGRNPRSVFYPWLLTAGI
jgi:penicillin-binding protein 1C